MNKKLLIFFLISLNGLTRLIAQNLAIFDLGLYKNESVGFISLSDIYPLSEHPDSLAIPDLRDKEIEEAESFEYFVLDSKYRKRFLSKTKISETDQVFIYDYSLDTLISFAVKNLNVIACLNIYGADWPYSQADYMIGFEINKKFLACFGKYPSNTIVYVGNQNPFVQGQIKRIEWRRIDPKDYPLQEPFSYDTTYAGKCVKGNAYKFETEGLQYFIQDFVRGNEVNVKCLLVIDLKTKKIVCKKNYYDGESTSFAPLDNQWTGKLFKNKPMVIFGFSYVSFGCPSITFLNPAEKDIYFNCDNRH